jgi:hypothetical protein
MLVLVRDIRTVHRPYGEEVTYLSDNAIRKDSLNLMKESLLEVA